jgi:hypothetical protein
VAAQLAEVKHSTHRMVVVSQTPAKGPPVHWAVVVHVFTQEYVFVSQT